MHKSATEVLFTLGPKMIPLPAFQIRISVAVNQPLAAFTLLSNRDGANGKSVDLKEQGIGMMGNLLVASQSIREMARRGFDRACFSFSLM